MTGPPDPPRTMLSLLREGWEREVAILRDVIELHPTHLAETELIGRRGVDPEQATSAEIGEWREAIEGLRRSGLLEPGEPVAPTFAALRFAELTEL